MTIRGLTKAYGNGPPVLRDVDMDIPPGVTGLLGPNGAGKSTLLQCILGLLKGWSGRAAVLGLDVRRKGRSLRARVGLMPELDAYLFEMKGLHAVRYLTQLVGLPRREALRRAHEVLWHVGLGEAIYRPIKEYSTGMRQRFKLAQAIAHDPQLVFLDEPLAGLDPDGRNDVRELIADLATNHGKHIVWSSHLLPDVQRVAGQVVLLRAGKCLGGFDMQDLAGAEGRFVVEVEGDGAPLVQMLEGIEGGAIEVEAVRDDTHTGIAAGHAEVALTGPNTLEARHLYAIAHHAGVRVRRAIPVRETLEDVVLRLLGIAAEAERASEDAPDEEAA